MHKARHLQETKVINFDTRPIMLIAGMMSVFSIGCITGTNTFSNATVPTTRYCSIADTNAMVFDIPAAADYSPATGDLERNLANPDTVSLVP